MKIHTLMGFKTSAGWSMTNEKTGVLLELWPETKPRQGQSREQAGQKAAITFLLTPYQAQRIVAAIQTSLAETRPADTQSKSKH